MTEYYSSNINVTYFPVICFGDKSLSELETS